MGMDDLQECIERELDRIRLIATYTREMITNPDEANCYLRRHSGASGPLVTHYFAGYCEKLEEELKEIPRIPPNHPIFRTSAFDSSIYLLNVPKQQFLRLVTKAIHKGWLRILEREHRIRDLVPEAILNGTWKAKFLNDETASLLLEMDEECERVANALRYHSLVLKNSNHEMSSVTQREKNGYTNDLSESALLAYFRERHAENTFKRAGDKFFVSFCDGNPFFLNALIGAKYIHYLLQHPGTPIRSINLVWEFKPPEQDKELATRALSDEDLNLSKHFDIEFANVDQDTRNDCRRNILDLRNKIEIARDCSNTVEADRCKLEIQSILEYLYKENGLLGYQRTETQHQKRSRQSVSKQLRSTLEKIKEYNKSLSEYLYEQIHIGSTLHFKDTDITWQT